MRPIQRGPADSASIQANARAFLETLIVTAILGLSLQGAAPLVSEYINQLQTPLSMLVYCMLFVVGVVLLLRVRIPMIPRTSSFRGALAFTLDERGPVVRQIEGYTFNDDVVKVLKAVTVEDDKALSRMQHASSKERVVPFNEQNRNGLGLIRDAIEYCLVRKLDDRVAQLVSESNYEKWLQVTNDNGNLEPWLRNVVASQLSIPIDQRTMFHPDTETGESKRNRFEVWYGERLWSTGTKDGAIFHRQALTLPADARLARARDGSLVIHTSACSLKIRVRYRKSIEIIDTAMFVDYAWSSSDRIEALHSGSSFDVEVQLTHRLGLAFSVKNHVEQVSVFEQAMAELQDAVSFDQHLLRHPPALYKVLKTMQLRDANLQ